MTEPRAEDVEDALEHVRARLRGHGGDASVAAIEDGEVLIRWHGACQRCPALALTYGAVVAPAVRSVDGVRAVRSERSVCSPFALRRIEAMAARHEAA
jgi:Fe-S cluster biogenesis protein NfuA